MDEDATSSPATLY